MKVRNKKTKMKKWLSVCLVLTILFTILPIDVTLPAFAETSTVTLNNITYEIDSEHLTAKVLKNSNPTDGKIVIPNEITENSKIYSVTTIGTYAFYMKTYSEISIGENVRTIESNAFGTSFDYVYKIEFQSSNCQTIASDAFDWMDFGSGFQLIVHGKSGSMDKVLAGVADLKAKTIIYVEPDAGEVTKALQKQIDSAPDQQETVIKITEDIGLTDTIVIPKNKNIVLTDDGTAHTIGVLPGETVEELFRVEKGASLTFDGDLTFEGGITTSNNKGNIVNVSGAFYLKRAVLTSGTIKECDVSGAVLLTDGATFEMSGGVIEKFNIDGSKSTLTAPVVVGSEAVFHMTGGEIRNNRNTTANNAAGGVLVYTWNNDPTATMTMSGDAKITGNQSWAGGGGMYLVGNTDVTISGGTISYNAAKGKHGGGVCVAGADGGSNGEKDITKFTMNGGEISHNESYNTGGGIYVNSNDVTLYAGRIENNIARSHGGGVYVSQTPFALHLYDVLVTGNTAKTMGGGLWFCPTGEAKLSVTNGAAIYGNTASGAGDDFVSLGKKEGSITLADRMLGGGPVAWYHDGAVTNNNNQGITMEWMQTGEVDDSVPRFDATNPGEPVHLWNTNGKYALKAIASDATKQLAASNAKLIIQGNQAERGGGIGSNGTVVIGKPEGDHTLQVVKVWSENTPDQKKTPLTVFLKIGDYLLDSVQLNTENNWTASFERLPDPETMKVQYAVVESPVPENFVPTYQDAVIKDDHTIQIQITNQYMPIGHLEVSKAISGDRANAEDEFSFRVELADRTINGTYGEMQFVNGIAEFSLKADESIIATKLPAGMAYTVSELTHDGYTVTVNGTSGDSISGTILADETVTAAFLNHKSGGGSIIPEQNGSVKVTKTVTGIYAPSEKVSYAFQIWIKNNSGTTVSERVSYKIIHADGTVESGKATIGADGYVFSLIDGDSITFREIDNGKHVEVQELTTGTFTTTTSGLIDGSCLIASGKTNTVSFVNDYSQDTPMPKPETEVTPNPEPTPVPIPEPEKESTTPKQDITPDRSLDKVPQTGDDMLITVWITLVCLSLLGIIITLFGRWYFCTHRK